MYSDNQVAFAVALNTRATGILDECGGDRVAACTKLVAELTQSIAAAPELIREAAENRRLDARRRSRTA